MSDPSIPSSALAQFRNEQEGTAAVFAPTAEPSTSPSAAQADLLKHIAAAVVGIATVGTVSLPEHTIAWKVCAAIVGLGAAFGIRSQGVGK